jgi:hypothetical protein
MPGTNSKTTAAPTSDAVIHSAAITRSDAILADPKLGDVTAEETDLLTPPEGSPAVDHGGEVVYNQTLADLPEGERCIAIIGGAQWLTPTEATRLSRQLDHVARHAATDRREKRLDD